MGGALASVGAVSALGMGLASAQSTTNTGDSLIDKLVAKFNLNKADVQKVFDEDHAAREAQHQADEKARLDQAVKDGKLTQDQEDKLIAKQKEMHDYMDSLKDKTEEERRSAMKTKIDELKQWAKDNGIAEEYLRPVGRGHRGPGGPPPSN